MAGRKAKRKRTATVADEVEDAIAQEQVSDEYSDAESENQPASQPIQPSQASQASQPGAAADSTSAAASTATGADGKKKVLTYNFSELQQKDLAIWYKENPIFYDKSLTLYKDTDAKEVLYEEKAATLVPKCSRK